MDERQDYLHSTEHWNTLFIQNSLPSLMSHQFCIGKHRCGVIQIHTHTHWRKLKHIKYSILFRYACMICSMNLISMWLIYRKCFVHFEAENAQTTSNRTSTAGWTHSVRRSVCPCIDVDSADWLRLHWNESETIRCHFASIFLSWMINNFAVDAQLAINDMKIFITSCRCCC